MPPPTHCVTHVATYPRTHSHTYVLWHAVASWRSYSPARTNAPKQSLTRANLNSRFHRLTDCQLLLTHPFTDSQPGSRTHCIIHALPRALTNTWRYHSRTHLLFVLHFPTTHSFTCLPTPPFLLTHSLSQSLAFPHLFTCDVTYSSSHAGIYSFLST